MLERAGDDPLNHTRAIDAFAVALVNLSISAPLLQVTFLDAPQSNETTYMTIAQFLLREWPNVEWFPWWDLGMPIGNTYFPGVPLLLAALHWLTGAEIPRLYHILSAAAYAAGPAGLYLLARALGLARLPALTSGLAWSLVTFSAILFHELRADLGGFDLPRRLRDLVFWGEGPHAIALALLPWALVAAARAIREPASHRIAAALALGAAAASMNAFGAIALIVSSTALLLALLPHVALSKRLLGAAAAAAAAYLLLAGALSPAMLETIRLRSQHVSGAYPWTSAKLGALLALALAVPVLDRAARRCSPATRFAALFLLCFAPLPALHYWFGFALAPQPFRYHAEFEIGAALAAGIAAVHARRFPIVVAILLAAIAGRQWTVHYAYAREQVASAHPDHTREIAIARWARRNFPHDRMMVSGSTGFPFNLFTTTLQTGSGHEPFTPNWHQLVATYAIHSGSNGGRDAATSLLWLKAFGARAVLVAGPVGGFPEIFANPKKFDGRLAVLADFDGWKIYDTGYRRHPLFRVVPAEALVRRPPVHGLDTAELEPFVRAIESSAPVQEVVRVHYGHYRLRGDFPKGTALSVAWNYDPGWTASSGSRPIKVERDGIGLIAFRPECSACAVELRFDPGPVRRAARLVSAVAWALLLAAVIRYWFPKGGSARP